MSLVDLTANGLSSDGTISDYLSTQAGANDSAARLSSKGCARRWFLVNQRLQRQGLLREEPIRRLYT